MERRRARGGRRDETDRNINSDGRGKYALILLRNVSLEEVGRGYSDTFGYSSFDIPVSAIDLGEAWTESEFFVIRLKDKYAAPALHAYADIAELDDPEWAAEVRALAKRAESYPTKKRPN